LTAHSQDLARGRELTLRLPIEIELPRIETFVQPPDAARSKSAGRRILVVDDNRDSATTLALLLKMTGNETCCAIRQQPWGKDMLIIALTGWGQEEDRRKTAQAGFDNHLVKPVDHVDLNKLILS